MFRVRRVVLDYLVGRESVDDTDETVRRVFTAVATISAYERVTPLAPFCCVVLVFLVL